MKALSFEQFFGLTVKEKLDYFDKLTGANSHTSNEYDRTDNLLLSEWYYGKYSNKPFEPGITVEMFEGWVYDTEYECYSFGSNRITSVYLRNAARTLNDFINDCQRAGIELNWRIK